LSPQVINFVTGKYFIHHLKLRKMKSKFFSFLNAALFVTGLLMPSGVFSQDKECNSAAPVFEVKQIEAQKAVVIKAEVPMASIGQAMGEAYRNLFTYLGSLQIPPAGAPFSVYYSFDPNGNTVFEAGVPVSNEIKGDGNILYKEYPAMKVVSTLYKGAYEAMEPIYGNMGSYIAENGLEATGTSWEVYLTDPMQVASPADNQTLIYFPVK
jgi:effector-binding domain-containing protein